MWISWTLSQRLSWWCQQHWVLQLPWNGPLCPRLSYGDCFALIHPCRPGSMLLLLIKSLSVHHLSSPLISAVHLYSVCLIIRHLRDQVIHVELKQSWFMKTRGKRLANHLLFQVFFEREYNFLKNSKFGLVSLSSVCFTHQRLKRHVMIFCAREETEIFFAVISSIRM